MSRKDLVSQPLRITVAPHPRCFRENCEAFATHVRANASAQAEYSAYLAGDEIAAALATFRARVGLHSNLAVETKNAPPAADGNGTTRAAAADDGGDGEVSADDLLLAWEACAYDLVLGVDGSGGEGVPPQTDRWCALFDDAARDAAR